MDLRVQLLRSSVRSSNVILQRQMTGEHLSAFLTFDFSYQQMDVVPRQIYDPKVLKQASHLLTCAGQLHFGA